MVSPCTTTEHSSATLPGPDSVIDAVCADPDLLTLEFEAIIDANYPPPADHPQRRPPRTLPASATRRTPPVPPAHPTTRTPERPAHVATPQRHRRVGQSGRARPRTPRRARLPPPRAHRGLAFAPTTPTTREEVAHPDGTGWTSRHPPPTRRGSRYAPSPTPPRSGSSAQHPPAPAPTAHHHGDRPTQPNSSGRPSTPATTIQPSAQHNRNQKARRSSSAVLRRREPFHPPHQPGAPVPCAPARRATVSAPAARPPDVRGPYASPVSGTCWGTP